MREILKSNESVGDWRYTDLYPLYHHIALRAINCTIIIYCVLFWQTMQHELRLAQETAIELDDRNKLQRHSVNQLVDTVQW